MCCSGGIVFFFTYQLSTLVNVVVELPILLVLSLLRMEVQRIWKKNSLFSPSFLYRNFVAALGEQFLQRRSPVRDNAGRGHGHRLVRRPSAGRAAGTRAGPRGRHVPSPAALVLAEHEPVKPSAADLRQ